MPYVPKGLLEKVKPAVLRLRADPVFFAESVSGFRFNQSQRRVFLLSGRVRVRLAGRRFGKTLLSALDLLHYAITRPGSKSLIVGPSLDQARIYFDYFRDWTASCPLLEYLILEDKHSPFHEISLRNGSVITSRSTSRGGRFIRGRGYDRITVTEAGFVPDEVYYAALRPALLQNPRAKLDFEGTPWSKTSFLYELFTKGLADGEYYSAIRATSYEAPHISKDELERIKAEVPEYYFSCEFLAEFPEDDEAVFPQAIVLRAVQDYLPAARPFPGHIYSMGVDLAKLHDYTVIIILDVSEKPWRIAEFHRFRGRAYAEASELINALRARYRARVVIDATGVGEAVAERVPGSYRVVITAQRREEMIARLRLALETGSLILPGSNMILLEELKHFREKGQRGFHDDCVFALALAVWGAGKGTGWASWRAGNI
ncbi:MAG: terminase family protein [candidate division WOR-3 bacterium]